MLSYQQQYIENVREILRLSDFFAVSTEQYDAWYVAQKQNRQRTEQLKRENNDLLSRYLFPTLDDLHNADAQCIADLEEFADQLMDWKTNLDCGVYVLIHDALLSLYRFARDRNKIIKELYKLGMGLYYLDRIVQGVDTEHIQPFQFRNEMIFTEAGSYLKFFADIDDSETRGYIIRALANISICTLDRKRRIAVSAKVLNIVQDDYYRSLAPELPWDVFLRRTNQQMSSNRTTLSRGNLTTQELEAIFDSCYEVFKPEEHAGTPNVRWLWPYYEMEYSCGFVDLETTLDRLQKLIESAKSDEYDVSGMYANSQLAIYYGILMRDNPSLQSKPEHVRFLAKAYHKMMCALLSCPVEQYGDYLSYLIRQVVSDYFEMDGVPSYRSIVLRLMQRFSGRLYVQSEQAAALLRIYCGTIFDNDPTFFDDIDFLASIADPTEKRNALLDYASSCGLYHDLGLIKMGLSRTMDTRSLFELEDRMFRLHTVSGHDDLVRRASTARFADIAFGHHSWYDGKDGYPESYVRNASPYRQMTDVVAVAAYLIDRGEATESVFDDILRQERTRFSPLVTVYLNDPALKKALLTVLENDEPYYRILYERINAPQEIDEAEL